MQIGGLTNKAVRKITLIWHALEVDSSLKQIVLDSVAADAHKDAESGPSLLLHSTVYSRNSPTQTYVQDVQTL